MKTVNNIVFQMLSHIRKILGNLAALIALGGILAYLDPVLLFSLILWLH